MLFGKYSIVILLLATFLVVNAQNEECGPNEVYTSCGSACPETCNSKPNRICTKQCVIGCVCRDGFVKGNDGKCIPKSSC